MIGNLMKGLMLPLLCTIVLSGCVSSADIGRAESKSNKESTDTVILKEQPALSAQKTDMVRLSRYGATLSDEFLGLADRSQGVRDVTTFALIAYAADAASTALGDAGAETLGRRAIIGTAVSQSSSFFNPATATGALLLAARRSQCLSNVAAVAVDSAPNRVEIIGAYLRTQFDVRNGLRGIAPDFSTLATAFANAVRDDPLGAKSTNSAGNFIDVKEAVASCMLVGE